MLTTTINTTTNTTELIKTDTNKNDACLLLL